jgi:hypothetical protein
VPFPRGLTVSDTLEQALGVAVRSRSIVTTCAYRAQAAAGMIVILACMIIRPIREVFQ